MNKEVFPVDQAPSKEELHEDTRAKSYVRDFEFSNALRSLREEGLMPQQVLRTKERYGESLESAVFMTEKDWEYLTMISLYSPELATHSVETYRLIRSKIERIHIGSETIAKRIEKEAGSLNEFYRAALFHDIGKLDIPESVMNHVVQPGDWHALTHAGSDPEHVHTVYSDTGKLVPVTKNFDSEKFMSEYDLNKSSKEPASSILPPEKIDELNKRGISPELTLRQIFNLHEEYTRNTLKREGLHAEADIAGQVHNYQKEERTTPTSSETIAVSTDAADIEKIILHIGDAQEALRSSERDYNKRRPHSQVATASILVQDAKKVPLSKLITALWIQEDMNELEDTVTPEDHEKIKEIKEFIRTSLSDS
ncbi:TPA: hypothetical protein DEP58_03885 [Patescibacteria group bacterium]|nr:MAG: hypothetical protein UU98_C0005G0034 [Parcubacteria group bacterium GW2011_GWD2_42_14]HCC05414.1 hypothetical protein [Patescibacteria group bacterium]